MRAARTNLWGRAVEIAATVGLLFEAGLAVALLRVWIQKETSFYLVNLGGAGTPIYVAQLAAWLVVFVLLMMGRRREAESFAILGAVLGILNFFLNTQRGHFWTNWQLPAGIELLGIVPAICLLVSPAPAGRPDRPMVWVVALGVVAVVANIFGGSLLKFVNDVWLAGVVVAVFAWWRYPWVALAAALMSVPILVISSAHRVVAYGGTLPTPIPLAVAVVLALLGVVGQRRLR